LRVFDGRESSKARRLILQRLNERVPRFLVIGVELVGDVLLLVFAFVEQRGGAAGEKILRSDKQP
jgi:hypothetical protein